MRKGLITGLAVLLATLPASAQEAAPQALQITALNVTAAEADRGSQEGAALPGDLIEYSLVFTNVTEGDISDVTFTDPIPAGLVLVLGSTEVDQSGVTVEYSVNGGQDWATEPVVDVPQPDGSMITQPAPAEAYTHIRWTVTGALAPGAQVSARFLARMPAAGQGVAS